jgi:proteasome lid subunit RPN8/RPN11
MPALLGLDRTADMIRWKEQPPDFKPTDMSGAIRSFGYLEAAWMIAWTIRRPPIFLSRGTYKTIMDHLSAGTGELGGLLLGSSIPLSYTTKHGYDHLTNIEKPVPSLEFVNSGYSLEMGTEVWSRAAEEMKRGLRVIGWYHSHPDLGAFFSPRDKATQEAFFGHGYSLGIVIDPIRDERKCYAGPKGQEIDIPWPEISVFSEYPRMLLSLTGTRIPHVSILKEE